MAVDENEWRKLAELAAKETDPEKLLDLVKRLNTALSDHVEGVESERTRNKENNKG
jgi:hypothetical protein